MLLKDGKRYCNAKKIICLMLVLFNMLVYLPVINFGASGEPIRYLKIGSIENGKVGNTYDVPISFENLPSKGINVFSFDLKYDNSKLEFVDKNIYIGNENENEELDFSIVNKNGKIEFRYGMNNNNDPVKSESKFAEVKFKIISNIESESIITAESLLVSPNGKYEVKNGKVTVSKPSTATNTPKNTPTNTPKNTPTNTPTPTSTPSNNLVNGLLGKYYDDRGKSGYFNKLVYTEITEKIEFNWGMNSPKEGIVPTDNFSVIWEGYFVPDRDGYYKFYTQSDDGVRLYFGEGQERIINNWNDHSSTEDSSPSFYLNNGEKYKIKLEYYENALDACIELKYSYNDFGKTIIPKEQLLCETATSKPSPTPTATQKKSTPTPTKVTATPTKTTATSTAAQSSPTPTATKAPYIPPYNPPPQPQPTVTVQPGPTEMPKAIPSDLSLALSSDKKAYDAGQNIVFTIHYRNRLSTEIGNVKLSSDIPPNTTFVEGAGGIVAGNKITWDLGTLQGNKEGTVKYTVKVDSFEGEDKEVSVTANIGSTSSTDATIDDNQSVLKLMLYSKKVLGSHKKYINGYTDGTFKPDKPITRAEISALIVRVSELNTASSDKQIFTDVSKDHWAFKNINTAVANGFFKGATATLFKPDANITKGELAAVICRCLGIEESSIDEEDFFFSDTKSHWAGKFIEELYRCKIVVGNAGKFYPKNQVTRAEAVTMINRWLYRGPLSGVTLKFKDVPTSHWGYGHIAEAVYDHKYSRDPKGGEKYEGEIK